MAMKRHDIPWRELPHLRIDECVEISGFSRRTITEALRRGELASREVAGIRVVAIADFRGWVGDLAIDVQPVSSIAENRAARLLRKIE